MLGLLVAPDLPAAQRATVKSFAELAGREVSTGDLLIDVGLIVSYVSFGWALLFLLRPDESKGSDGRSIAAAGCALVLGAGVADLLEDVLLWRALEHKSGNVGGLLDGMRAAGVVKWSLLGAAVVALLLLLLTRPRPGYERFPADHRPEEKEGTPHPWDPPRAGEPTRLGICLSGGGIRSAAFALGGLQALQDKEMLDRAEYLAAASGGGYLAAGWAVSDAESAGAQPAVWSRGSPEERWFRDHSSYLIPDLARGLRGVGRLLAGVVVNFMVVWLLLFLIARPVGWLGAAFHPELKAVEPVALPRDTAADMAIGDIGEPEPATGVVDGAAVPVQRYEVSLLPQPSSSSHANEVCFDTKPFVPSERTPCFAVTQVPGRPAVIEVRGGNAEVLVQPIVQVNPCAGNSDSAACKAYEQLIAAHPTAAVVPPCAGDDASVACEAFKQLIAGHPTAAVNFPCAADDDSEECKEYEQQNADHPTGTVIPPCAGDEDSEACKVYKRLEIAEQPKLAVTDAAVDGAVRADQLEVSTQARARSTSGLRHRPDPIYDPWMWQASLGLLFAGAIGGFVVMAGRLRRRRRETGRYLAVALALAGVVVLLVTIALPALATWLPTLAVDLPGTDAAWADSLLPTGGLLAVSIASARQYFLGSKKGAGTTAAKPSGGSDSFFGRIRTRLKGSEEQLTWYESSPTKVFLYVLLIAGFVVSFVVQLQYSMSNGITGRLLGLGFARSRLPDVAFLPEWVRFVLVSGAMGVFACTVDAHAWSLYPFYKRRLSSAYILRRAGRRAQQIPYDQLVPFTLPERARRTGCLARASGQRETSDRAGKDRAGPKLVLCCAVNLSEPGIVPPGRRAGSFTFAGDYIGGPLVGYVRSSEYWACLPESRQRDITVPSAMAISGAAFSPAMGKANLGPVGSVLALANLRLGVWLPHPQRVTPVNEDKWKRRHRPGWTWFIREVMNKYRFQRRYLYVSDGGHWDNLGLVELLRRGCTEIVCISAAGDGATSFGTIAEAIALAREELGVDIDLDPTPLRPPADDAEPAEPADEELGVYIDVDPGPMLPPVDVAGTTGPAGTVPTPTDPAPARELRRAGSKDTASPFAPGSSVTGTYTWRTPEASGKIFYIETALTDDLPFDVHGFAEAETIFPDDATGDQVFNHRQFESFRALGYHQVSSAL